MVLVLDCILQDGQMLHAIDAIVPQPSAKNDQIIQIDQAVDEGQLTHTILHKSLESSWSITKSKRHSITLKEP